MENKGNDFIARKYNLHTSPEVASAVTRHEGRTGKKVPNNPEAKVGVYLDRLSEIFNYPDEDTRKRRIEIFKEKILYPSVLIDKNNVPDSYFESQLRIARERGYAGDLGDIKKVEDIDERVKREAGKTIYEDQKKSLDVWVDYLNDKETVYPPWFKYYTIRNVVKMGSYDKEKKEFEKRSKGTTNIFPDLNREALSFVFDVVKQRYVKNEKHGDEELKRILDTANFSKIYAYAIEKVTPASKENKEKIEGEWVKFTQGDDYVPLYESLQGHGTGWCTAGEETARIQLENGDFYVYYSKDLDNKNTIPRIAIRMENGMVAEVRGIEADQNLEASMVDIAKDKYSKLPGGDKYEKKDQDMRLLTLIDKKNKEGQELSKEELKFLYEIGYRIEGFGYERDPRIWEILRERVVSKDLSLILPEKMEGNLDLSYFEELSGVVFPKTISGNLDLFCLDSAKDLKFPDSIGGNLRLTSLRYIENLEFSRTKIDGELDMSSLELVEDIQFPESVGGDLDLRSLEVAKKVRLPKTINGSLNLFRLESAVEVEFSERIEGSIFLNSLELVDGLVLPDRVGGSLDLSDLKSAKGVKLPKKVGGDLRLSGLESVDGLTLPERIDGCLYLKDFKSIEGLDLSSVVIDGVVSFTKSVSSDQRELFKGKYPKVTLL